MSDVSILFCTTGLSVYKCSPKTAVIISFKWHGLQRKPVCEGGCGFVWAIVQIKLFYYVYISFFCQQAFSFLPLKIIVFKTVGLNHYNPEQSERLTCTLVLLMGTINDAICAQCMIFLQSSHMLMCICLNLKPLRWVTARVDSRWCFNHEFITFVMSVS